MNEKLFQKFYSWLSLAAIVVACLYFPYLILQGRLSEILDSLLWGFGMLVVFALLALISPKLLYRVGDLVGATIEAYLKFFFNSLLVFVPVYLFGGLSRWMVSLELFWFQALSLSLWGIVFLVSIRILVYEDRRVRFFKWLRERISGFAPWAYSFNLIWIGVFFFASLTYLLVDQGRVSLFPPGDSSVSFDSFLDFYLWHFIKAIPAFAVNDTLRWQEPLTYEGGWIGPLLLAFKITVISPIIGAFIWYWRFIAGEKQAEQKKRDEEKKKLEDQVQSGKKMRKTIHRTYRPRRRVWR